MNCSTLSISFMQHESLLKLEDKLNWKTRLMTWPYLWQSSLSHIWENTVISSRLEWHLSPLWLMGLFSHERHCKNTPQPASAETSKVQIKSPIETDVLQPLGHDILQWQSNAHPLQLKQNQPNRKNVTEKVTFLLQLTLNDSPRILPGPHRLIPHLHLLDTAHHSKGKMGLEHRNSAYHVFLLKINK